VRIGLSGFPWETHRAFGQAIARAIDATGRRAGFIASGDLSHKLLAEGPYGFAPEGPVFDEKIGQIFESERLDGLFEMDEDFVEAMMDIMEGESCNAEYAVEQAGQQFAEMFAAMDDAYMQARSADIKDVARRILDNLMGVVAGGIDSDVPVILAADDLAPSETLQLDKSKILAFATQGGSGNSHTAILARTMGIPAICPGCVLGNGAHTREEYVEESSLLPGLKVAFELILHHFKEEE
jgi:hypothetical protein